ncbi:hypothetical protein GCM10023216_19420 [Isoptericola chiayiensis]|uniref:Lipoprotein n=1 Tax=Isoptericola chiayiensis TaxID=579446 RepID=A0ABP8YG66_9MICO|nr:hypothetical protein [Isoptericola chiayiensis]NOW00170.1 hypothetical protein [Isoptericola chiayiensis]
MTGRATARPTPVAAAVLTVAVVLLAGCGADNGATTAVPASDASPSDASSADPAQAASPEPASAADVSEPPAEDDGRADGGDEPDVDAFCATAAPALRVVDREVIGSTEHVEMLEAVSTSAAEDLGDDDLAADVADLAEHYAADVSPADPESQNFDAFPTRVQELALDVQESVTDLC